jgi:hypothetical protein
LCLRERLERRAELDRHPLAGGDRRPAGAVPQLRCTDFDAFAPRIVEGMTAAGIEPQGPPDIKEFPVHEIIGA